MLPRRARARSGRVRRSRCDQGAALENGRCEIAAELPAELVGRRETQRDKIGLGALTPITALLITISNLGALGAWFAAVGRLPFVAGIDRYLPPAFGKLHPRWQSPYVALLVQAGCAIVFIFLGQAGASVYSAYEVLVSIGIISYFIPYLYLFASLIKLQREPAAPEIIRVPGGKPVAYFIGTLGFVTSVVTIILSLVPPSEEPHKLAAVLKIVIATAAMIGIGVALFYAGRRRVQRAANSAR